MSNFPEKLSHAAKILLGQGSASYRFSTKAYHALCGTLVTLGMPARFFESSAESVRRLARQSCDSVLSEDARHIVFFSIRGWALHLDFEVILASFLRSEGHKVSFVSCSESLPFCMHGSVSGSPENTRNCQKCMNVKAGVLGNDFVVDYLPGRGGVLDPIDDIVEKLDLLGCLEFEYEGAPYGELVRRGISWYLRRSRLDGGDVNVYREALVSAHLVRRGLENYLSKNRVDTVVMLNGDFSAERTASWVLSQNNIHYMTHDFTFHDLLAVGYDNSVWDDFTYGNSDFSNKVVQGQDLVWAENLLRTWREQGGYQGHLFWKKKGYRSLDCVRKDLLLDDRPLAVAFTNMTFESSVAGKDRVFDSQFHWLNSLLKFFGGHPELQLAIRIHPAEVRASEWRPKESLFEFLCEEVPEIPDNVRVVAPQDKLSSYSLGLTADAILVYSSTIGMEMVDRDKCVITAADVHYARCGFTFDPATVTEYFDCVSGVLNKSVSASPGARHRLVNYIAWLFLNRLTPFEAIDNISGSEPRVNVDDINNLRLSKYKGVRRVAYLVLYGKKWWADAH